MAEDTTPENNNEEEKNFDTLTEEQQKIDAVKKANEQITKYNEEHPNEPMELLGESASFDNINEVMKRLNKINNNHPSAKDDNQNQSGKRGTTEVNSEEKPDWLKEKEQFWKTYAEENKFGVQTEIKDGKLNAKLSNRDKSFGSITYTSAEKVTISSNATIELYQGLVKDAMKNELSVTFGDSLDDKQKAMLMAACLMNKDKYKNGEDLEMVNAPKIDVNAEYFKELPEEVQKTLSDYAKKQEAAEKTNKAKNNVGNDNTNKTAANDKQEQPEQDNQANAENNIVGERLEKTREAVKQKHNNENNGQAIEQTALTDQINKHRGIGNSEKPAQPKKTNLTSQQMTAAMQHQGKGL